MKNILLQIWVIISLMACQSSSTSSSSGTPGALESYTNAQTSTQKLSSSVSSASSALSGVPNAPTNLPNVPTLPAIPSAATSALAGASKLGVSSGGGTFGSMFDRMFGRVVSLTYVVQSNANGNDGIMLELALNYQAAISPKILAIQNKDWFNLDSQGAQSLKQLPEVTLYRWQVTPDQDDEMTLLQVNKHAYDGFVFIRYTNMMESYPVRVDPYKNIFIVFEQNSFKLIQF